MKKNNIYIYIIFGLLIVLLLFVTNFYNNKNNKEDTIQKTEKNKIKILSNYDEFFTINSCVYKYISYLQSKDYNSVLKILNSDYKKNNNITESNIENFVENLDGKYSFSTKKIYYEVIDNNYTRYYVYGYLSKDMIDVYGEKEDRYYIILFDTKNQLFSLTPYNEVGFKEVTSE